MSKLIEQSVKTDGRLGTMARAKSRLQVVADDAVFRAAALAFAAFIGSKGLDKLPFWGTDRVSQLEPFAEFFGLPVTALLVFTSMLQIAAALAFVGAAILGSRRLFGTGVGVFICNMGYFLVGDVGAKAHVKASVQAAGGTFKDSTMAHIDYALGAVAIYVLVLFADYLRGSKDG